MTMSAAGSAGLLEIDSISISYRGLKAVSNISLSVAAGERVAVIGPNGAGKTTLFKAVSGEVQISSGSVTYQGRRIDKLPPFRRARLGLGRTYQITNLFPGLSVAETIYVSLVAREKQRWSSWSGAKMSGETGQRIEDIARAVRLQDRLDVSASHLSHGEQRQLEIAAAVASSPGLLLLDEPAAGLTVAERGMLLSLIKELPRTMSVLLIEHDMDIALGAVDRVLCMSKGEQVAVGTPEEIRESADVQMVYLGSA